MVRVGLLVLLEAKPGKEADVANFLRGGLSVGRRGAGDHRVVRGSPGGSMFGVFDASPGRGRRDAHRSGRVAALTANASELLAEPPTIEQIDVLAAKLPH